MEPESAKQSTYPAGDAAGSAPIGHPVEINGPVAEIVRRPLPRLHKQLFARPGMQVYPFEAHRHLDDLHVRAITLHSAAGPRRGRPVYDAEGPLRIPVAPRSRDGRHGKRGRSAE